MDFFTVGAAEVPVVFLAPVLAGLAGLPLDWCGYKAYGREHEYGANPLRWER